VTRSTTTLTLEQSKTNSASKFRGDGSPSAVNRVHHPGDDTLHSPGRDGIVTNATALTERKPKKGRHFSDDGGV
jgi:hypothetical protein